MISFSVLQMKGFLSEFNIAKDSLSVADSISASGSQYIYSSVDTINAVDSIITKVYPDTLTYTFGDTLFQKLIQPCFQHPVSFQKSFVVSVPKGGADN